MPEWSASTIRVWYNVRVLVTRRAFLQSTAAMAIASGSRLGGKPSVDDPSQHHFPARELRDIPYIEETPVPEYHWAREAAYEAFRDIKFGARIHWGIYSIWHRGNESWPFLDMPFAERDKYNELYKTWNPVGFSADEWTNLFQESGAKMFSFTSKHHEGFSMFDTKSRVRSRTNWATGGAPKLEACDLAYSIMETPFRRDIVKELCDAAHKRNLKIDLYFSHPDWYDADFRPYGYHPIQAPDSVQLTSAARYANIQKRLGEKMITMPAPNPAEVQRMMARHRAQLTELLSNYGKIDMMCLDIDLGPTVWPELRKTMLHLRSLQPEVMFRNRGIGNYGDYYTPERFFPGGNEGVGVPWFVIYPLGKDFSYDADAAGYKGAPWIIRNLVDVVAKGGNFMAAIGPDGNGQFHPTAISQFQQTGAWLKVNGEGIYATREREGALWSEGENIRYTRSKDRRTIYAFAMQWPGKELTLTSVKPKPGSSIHMLGYPKPLKWSQDAAKGATIYLPDNLQDESHRPCQMAWGFKIQTDPA
ncbi:MAG: hypothetical protein NVS9B4_18140 [Candidatus Acidiferrum sp.]